MPSSFWVASTKPEAALARGQGWQPWQERGWTLAPRDRGPEAGMYCRTGHYPLPVMPPSFWVASTKPEAALARGQGWQPWQERGWTLAPRDRGPEAGMYCWMGH